MFNIAKRDVLIGLRELYPIIKWGLLIATFITICSITLNLEGNHPNQTTTPQTTKNEVVYGLCCSEIKIDLDTFKPKLYQDINILEKDLKKNHFDSYIVVNDKDITVNSNNQIFIDEVSKIARTTITSAEEVYTVEFKGYSSDHLLKNSLWVFVCLLSLIPIALSETLIGNDFKSGRLSEHVCASGSPVGLIFGKLIAVGSVTAILCFSTITALCIFMITAFILMISNDPLKLNAIQEATSINIENGAFQEVGIMVVELATHTGIHWLVAGALILSLQITGIIMLINLASSAKSLKKSFIEKSVAIFVWLPLLIPVNPVVATYLPFFSVYDIAANVGPGFTPSNAITINIGYLLLVMLLVVMSTLRKREWHTAN